MSSCRATPVLIVPAAGTESGADGPVQIRLTGKCPTEASSVPSYAFARSSR